MKQFSLERINANNKSFTLKQQLFRRAHPEINVLGGIVLYMQRKVKF